MIQQTPKTTTPDPWDIGFGVVIFLAALIALFVWFPVDIPTGFFYINAIGREEPGDAFFPVILATLLVAFAAIHVAITLWRSYRGYPMPVETAKLTVLNFKFLVRFCLILAGGLTTIYWLGPLTVSALDSLGWLNATYRELTDTAPYKYIGYAVGGFLMTIALIAWTEGRISRAGVFSVLITLAVAILVFDVLLKNVLLPPNADF